MKRVNISVLNDLVTDQRLHRIVSTLRSMDFDVNVVGRELKGSLSPEIEGVSFHRFRIKIEKGPLSYISFNIRLLFYLLFRKRQDLYIAFDLDTLLPNYLISRLRKVPLLYDSHEYFTELPELQGRNFVKGVWEKLERRIVPRLKYAMTVSGAIANAYTERYGVGFLTVRNFPRKQKAVSALESLELKKGRPKIIYQGALNMGRGLELLIESMQYLDGIRLIIAGSGYAESELRAQAADLSLGNKVEFLGSLKPEELKEYTKKCSLGFSLEEDLGLNYRFALPNKIFDYIQAGVPVLCSDLPEMAKLVRKYEVGEVCASRNPEELAAQIRRMLESSTARKHWAMKLEVAAERLVWEREEKKLKELVGRAVGSG